MLNNRYVIRDVNDMYLYAEENNLPLLSDYIAEDATHDFWNDYTTNHEEYDKIFRRLYKHFRYFDQDIDGDNPVADVTQDFIDAVKGHLMLNDKKYTMLYLLHVNNTVLDPYNDYKITETKQGARNVDTELVSGERTDETTDVAGARQDSTNNTYGQRTDVTTDQIMAYNSATFVDNAKSTSEKGAETDSASFSKGSQTDTSSFSKGEQTDTQSIDETNSHTITVTGAKENQSKNMREYADTWSRYEFYSYIFRKISEDLLLV